MKPADHEDRERALASARNVAVTAGAGTGKTTLLVSKIVRKVTQEKMDIRRILALTFTEKAANEMRVRVREELEKAGKTEGLDRAEIGTIHSFCAHVLRQFPVEAGVAPDFRVDEGQAFRRLFDRAWPAWLDRELGADAPRPRQWKELLSRVKMETVQELARGMASFGIPEERRDSGKTLGAFVRALSARFPELKEALTGQGAPPKAKSGIDAEQKSARKLAEDVAKIDPKLTGRAVALTEDFARGFRADYLAGGYVSFDAMLALLHELLRSRVFPNVLELLRARYQLILVDEFQDTDPLQGEIIQRLAEGPDGRLVPGKLFLVGDPKQSIYSFRGADIIAYQGLVKRILDEGGEPVVLRTNFRSHGEILGLVNEVFSKAIVEKGPLQPRYEPIEPEKGRKPALPGPTLEAVLIEEASAGESREMEAEAVAEWIAGRGIAYREIAILFKALSDVSVYIEALRARNIPYVVSGEKLFYGTPEVIDFVNLLRVVENPHDRVALAGLLRSPYGAMSDQELYARRKALDDPEVPVLKRLPRWRELAGRIGVRELIELLFEESFALEIAQAGWHGEQAVANLLKLRQKAVELEAQGGCTLREFTAEARRAVLELEEEGESPLADETLDAVKILSIHKAKGLEFPVVILPDLHRQPVARDDRIVRFDWPTRTLGVRLEDAVDAGGAALAWLDRERRREEEKRLLYVAMTRAEEILFMLGSAEAKGGTYLELLLPDLEKRAKVRRIKYKPPARPPVPPVAEGERPDWTEFVERWRAREKRARLKARMTSPSRLEESDGETRGGSGPAPRAAEIGVLCHSILEHLDFGKPEVPEGTDPEAAGILEGFFRSAPFRELADSEILARELPFVLEREGQVVSGVIDVVYRRAGKLFVGDYKTDKIVEPEAYGLIREIYVDAVRRVLGTEPGFKLFYLRHGKAVDA